MNVTTLLVPSIGTGGLTRVVVGCDPPCYGPHGLAHRLEVSPSKRSTSRRRCARRRATLCAPGGARWASRRRRGDGSGAESDLGARLTGLAFSGGGIRSATFALGVLQRLAWADLLKRFDYLSTVSGGGYIGGSLTWLLSRTTDPESTGARLPYGVRGSRIDEDESDVLRHLRLHGNYLTPVRGITAMSLAAVVLRGIVLNFLVWIPLAVLAFLGLQRLEVYVIERTGGYGYPAALALVGAVFLVASVFYSLATWRPVLPQPYRRRRVFERGVRRLLQAGLVLAGLCSLPLVHGWLSAEEGFASVIGGAAALVAGVAGGLGTFAGSGAGGRGKIPVGVLAPAASILVLYGLALVSYDLGARYLQADSPFSNGLLGGARVSRR